MDPWLWWTAPAQRHEQDYCVNAADLTPSERAAVAAFRRGMQAYQGRLYGERKAEDSNPNAVASHRLATGLRAIAD